MAEFSKWQLRIFVTAWIGYALFYLCRANFSVAIPGIMGELGYSKTALGAVGSALFGAYAIGQVVNGQLGDRFGPRKLVTLGIVVSAVANFLFGFTTALPMMILLWGVNGFFQGMGWSPNVKLLSEWFSAKDRSKLTGLYGSCYQIGNAASWVLAGYLADTVGWRYAFWLPALIFGLSSIMYYSLIRDNPEEAGLVERRRTRPSGFRTTMRITFLNPQIWIVAIAFLFVDIVRYGFFVWAPTFLFEVQNATISEAAFKSVLLPLAGSLGAISTGWLTQKYFKDRIASVSSLMLVALGILAWIYPHVPEGNWQLSLVILVAIGYFTYGPHILMVATIPMDLGEGKATASVTGFIDGFGYVGATLVSVVSGWLIDNFDWWAAFNFWIISAFIAAGLMATLWNYKAANEDKII